MFKKLRNKLLMVNIPILALLIGVSFSVIYFITAQNVYHNIDRELYASIKAITAPRPQAPVEEKSVNLPRPRDFQDDNVPFVTVLRYTIDADGTITNLNRYMKIADEELLELLNAKIPEIISYNKNRGKVIVSGTQLEYQFEKFHNMHALALGDFSSETRTLRNLLIILILVGFVAMALAMFIGLITVNNAIRPIEESYNKQKQFVADASHELKTPLTTINTNIDVLLSHGESTIGDEKKWLMYIKNEATRMSKLTNDLLYLARLDHDENLMLSEVSFSESIQSILLTMEAVAFENNITVEENIRENVVVKAASDKLKQLVMILMDNALKYTPTHGKVTVSLTVGKEAVLKIRNTGDGIDKEDMKQIFERFYRSDKSRTRESGGYGLGLAIAKAITESFGGHISVNSVLGEYTEFTVNLPMA